MALIDKPVLSIGSLRPMGRSGILVDWAVLQNMGAHPVTVVAGVVINEEDVEAVESSLLRRQLNSFMTEVKIDAVKTGLLVTRENIETIATFFEDNQHHVDHLVVDACLESSEEMVLLSSTAVSLLKMRLLPQAEVVVAYPSEAERLSGQPVKSITEMKEAAEAIKIYGSKYVLIKADRRIDDEWVDVLYDGIEHQLLFIKEEPRINWRLYRDVFSSALAVFLLNSNTVQKAVESANNFTMGYRIPE